MNTVKMLGRIYCTCCALVIIGCMVAITLTGHWSWLFLIAVAVWGIYISRSAWR